MRTVLVPPAVLRTVLQQPAPIRTVLAIGQGPSGPSGPAGAGYTHVQAVASDTWTIPHNLGYRPAVELIDDTGQEFSADVHHLTDNTLVVSILVPIAGTARLN